MKFDERPQFKQEDNLTLQATQKHGENCHICGQPTGEELHACLQDVPASTANLNDPYLGQVLGGHYEIMSRIGEGGMSVVYKAKHELLNKVVAVKVLKPMLAMDAVKLARFQQEALSVSKLDHPNIIRVHHFAIPAKSEPFLVMDFVDGEPLADVLEREGKFTLERAANIFTQVCSALAHAHETGIVHRDIKPSNILICRREDGTEFVKIVDFGIAKLVNGEGGQSVTQTGEVFGSPLYMSPEQCAGKQLDARSDIYSTACVLFEMLTGRPPMMGSSALDTMQMHVFETPPSLAKERPDLAHAAKLDSIMFKALAKHPARRHQSISEFQADVDSLLDHKSSSLLGDARDRIDAYNAKKSATAWKPRMQPRMVPVVAVCLALMLLSSFMVFNAFNKLDWGTAILQGQQQFDLGKLDGAKATFEKSLNSAQGEKSDDKKLSSLQELVDVDFSRHDKTSKYHQQLKQLEAGSGIKIDSAAALSDLAALTPSDIPRAKEVLNQIMDDGVTCIQNGQLTQAQTLMEPALNKARQILGPDSKPELRALLDLGIVYCNSGQKAKGKQFLLNTIDLAKKLQDHALISKALLELANVNLSDSNYSEARKFNALAKDEIRHAEGPSSKMFASTLLQSSRLAEIEGRYTVSERELKQALAILTKLSTDAGTGDKTTQTELRLAALYTHYLNQPAAAHQILDRLKSNLEATEPKKAEDWHLLAQTLMELAFIGDMAQQFEESLPLIERAVAILSRVENYNKGVIAEALTIKARLEWHLNKPTAEQTYFEALKLMESNSGPNSPSLAPCLQDLGKMYIFRKNYTAAETMLRRAADLSAVVDVAYGEHAATLSLLASALDHQGKTAEAAAIRAGNVATPTAEH